MSKLKKALEKARLTRHKDHFSPPLGEVNAHAVKILGPLFKALEEPKEEEREEPKAQPLPPPKDEPVRKEISPSYHKTRVVSIDKKTLRRNKIISHFHEDALSDEIKILSMQILQKMDSMAGNTLLITSAKPYEGKTVTAINLALSICLKVDRTVLLVDADLRKPDIHRYLGMDIGEGLSDYLLYQAEISNLLINPGIDKLTILPGGKAVPNSTELLGSPRMEKLVKEMKERYPERFIIFDASSLLARADPLVFSRYIDGILLVVEAEKTSERDMTRALDLLKEKTIVGIVLNKSR